MKLEDAKAFRRIHVLDAMARVLYDSYTQMLWSRLQQKRSLSEPLDRQSETYQRYFKSAAASCRAIGARPTDYIKAQFEAFARYSRGKRKARLPQPNQIFGLGAQARYVEFAHARREADRRDGDLIETATPEYAREERKLRGLIRATLLPEADVLVTHPDEFTPRFLKHKGVWDLVQATYHVQIEGE